MYRKLFKLSAEQMANEPIDQFQTNIFILSEMNKWQEYQARIGAKQSGGR